MQQLLQHVIAALFLFCHVVKGDMYTKKDAVVSLSPTTFQSNVVVRYTIYLLAFETKFLIERRWNLVCGILRTLVR